MLNTPPAAEELTNLIGKSLYDVWNGFVSLLDENYDMERIWDSGGKAWKYEYKYRRGGKTLCALYAREHRIGIMIIFGKDERANGTAVMDFAKEVLLALQVAEEKEINAWYEFHKLGIYAAPLPGMR